MKYYFLIVMVLVMGCSLLLGINELQYPLLIMQFKSTVAPFISNGVVNVGITSIDSLNTKYDAYDFEYQNIPESQYIRDILLMSFINGNSLDMNLLLQEYRTYGLQYCNFIEIQDEPMLLSIANEYLASNTISHSINTLSDLDNHTYCDNWNFYYGFGTTSFNQNLFNQYSTYYSGMSFEDVGLHAHPLFPYRHKVHGNASLWNFIPQYNNIYKAWDYTKGEGVTVINGESTYYGTHPDLINQWNMSYLNYANLSIPNLPYIPSNYDQWQGLYHATNIAGILVGEDEDTQESQISCKSSVGIAPNAKIIGTYCSNTILDNFIRSHPTENVKVLSLSVLLANNNYTRLWINRYVNDLNILVCAARAYTGYTSTGPIDLFTYSCELAQQIDGMISVGDYNPDYSVNTKYNLDTTLNYNPNWYKVEISAPGWRVWTTSFTTNQSSTNIEPMITTSSCTSSATPQVSGVAVLVASKYPWMTASQIERQIKLGAHHLDDMINANASIFPRGPIPSDFWGAGCLNAYGSLFLHGGFGRDFVFENEENNTALIGRGFELENSTMNVENGVLRIEKDANVLFTNSTLNLADNVTVILEGNAKITLDQSSRINIGNNVTFTNENNEPCYGIFVNGDNQITLNNCSFVNCDLNMEYGSLEAVNSSFINSAINCNRTNVQITDCPTLGGIYCNGSDHVEIRNNTENTYSITGMYDGVTLINCGETYVYGYNITGNARHGVNLHESYGHNTIENCTVISNFSDGVRLYHANARIIGCYISGNNKGIIAYRGSNVEIYKDPNTEPWFHDSCISNNTWIEILFTDDCDLQMANGMNKILDAIPYDPNTFDKYLVFCPNMTRSRDFRFNYWGLDPWGEPEYPPEERFLPPHINPEENEIGYDLEPLWNPGPPHIITWENDELVYHNAIDLALAENIDGAIFLFKDLISQYPGSDYAPAAAKNLLDLEEDKQALKNYYATEPNLHWNGEIDKLVDYLENYCNIQMGDYQAAIAWFEDVISNPSSELDSLMAVIDLGYVYLLMQENPLKSPITCLYPQFAPKSRAEYERHTDALLSALYSQTDSDHGGNGNDIPLLVQYPVLHSNYPNPFNPSTTISYTLPKDMHCQLVVYNIKGQKVKTLFNGISIKGTQSVVWNGLDDKGINVSSGMYFYKLITPGNSITKKMIMMK